MKPSAFSLNREQLLFAWASDLFAGQIVSLEPASSDASFRRYFRLMLATGESRIVMDAPPEHENCRPFVKIAKLLAEAGMHVPQVFAQDFEQGFLLLSDLGRVSYLSALMPNDPQKAWPLYQDACRSLAMLQKYSKPGVLPIYSREVMTYEMELFPVWYLDQHLGVKLTNHQATELYQIFDLILDNNLAQPQVFVHRDYHSRNLMVFPDQNPGVLDFQDALYGPITYDLVSLFRDAYIQWDEEFELDWVIRYWEYARAEGLPVHEDFAVFYQDYEWMGVQRQLKVLGIFARLFYRDGKNGYLGDMPRVLSYLRRTCARYDDLKPLLRLIDEAHGVTWQSNVTF